MKLYEGKIGRTYIVNSVLMEEKVTRRLETLGLNEQTPLVVLNKKGSGTMIIKVRGTRLALGQRIAKGIDIREAKPDEWR